MKIFEDPRKMTERILADRQAGHTVGLAPTLGFLHDGHLALIARARKDNSRVVVSRFVNPTQFRSKAFREYPRDEKRDLEICETAGVDYVFSPAPWAMYPEGFDTTVEIKDLAGRLEGSSIRWHFRGVATVVVKLFNITQPHRAYFGKKDAHQLAILRRMAEDLNFPVKLIAVPTKRGPDGLALSSRNSLLSEEERAAALIVPKSLRLIESRIRQGETRRGKLRDELIEAIDSEPLARVEFAAVVDAKTLREDKVGEKILIYAAVHIGGKRLTDNRVV